MGEVARSVTSERAVGGWCCPRCDQEVRDRARFCQNCGRV
ncbi:MAG: zinc-ribbon domain-containing protein [bacterium JZ-2024 1]